VGSSLDTQKSVPGKKVVLGARKPHEGAKKEECREDQQNLRGLNIISFEVTSHVTAAKNLLSKSSVLTVPFSWLEEKKLK